MLICPPMHSGVDANDAPRHSGKARFTVRPCAFYGPTLSSISSIVHTWSLIRLPWREESRLCVDPRLRGGDSERQQRSCELIPKGRLSHAQVIRYGRIKPFLCAS